MNVDLDKSGVRILEEHDHSFLPTKMMTITLNFFFLLKEKKNNKDVSRARKKRDSQKEACVSLHTNIESSQDHEHIHVRSQPLLHRFMHLFIKQKDYQQSYQYKTKQNKTMMMIRLKLREKRERGKKDDHDEEVATPYTSDEPQ